MAELIHFSDRQLREWRERAEHDLYFFQTFLLRDHFLHAPIHLPLCRFLEDKAKKRKCICGFRGSVKSKTVQAWLLQQGLYNDSWSALLVEQRERNAIRHVQSMQDKFLYGPTAGLLQDMYADRLPHGFKGWNSGQIVFKKKSPNAPPFLRIGSLEGRLESDHVDCIVGDDLEGADAEKSDAPNEESERFALDRAVPLLIKPAEGYIIIVGTPHGPKPLVWKLRRLADEQEEQEPGNPLNWSYWWQPLLDGSGETVWPENFPDHLIRGLKAQASISSKSQELWDKQYMLRERSASEGSFNLPKIEENFFELKGGRILRYPADEFDPTKLDDEHRYLSERKYKHVDLAACRFFMHCDPIHKDPAERRTLAFDEYSSWGLHAVAVAPDFHCFVLESWIEDAPFDDFVEVFFNFYRKYQPIEWTWEGIGAQSWFKHHLRQLERTKYRMLRPIPTSWRPGSRMERLSAPSTRIKELSTTGIAKETYIAGQLEIPFHMGWLHLNAKNEKMLHELRIFPHAKHSYDGLDALAQGPGTWRPPISPEAIQAAKKREEVKRWLAQTDKYTGYSRPHVA